MVVKSNGIPTRCPSALGLIVIWPDIFFIHGMGSESPATRGKLHLLDLKFFKTNHGSTGKFLITHKEHLGMVARMFQEVQYTVFNVLGTRF